MPKTSESCGKESLNLSIFTLEHEKTHTCKTAIFSAFIRKNVYLYVLQCQKHRNPWFKSL